MDKKGPAREIGWRGGDDTRVAAGLGLQACSASTKKPARVGARSSFTLVSGRASGRSCAGSPHRSCRGRYPAASLPILRTGEEARSCPSRIDTGLYDALLGRIGPGHGSIGNRTLRRIPRRRVARQVISAGPRDRALGVVDDHAHGAESFEGTTVVSLTGIFEPFRDRRNRANIGPHHNGKTRQDEAGPVGASSRLS
jgi:hypothetical protein